MSIGVAIPCYFGHITALSNLLDSIENQTRKPNKVVVSCSSTKTQIEVKNYSFELEIIVTEDKKNAAQNRNIAASKLKDMDYITFIDADDIMHPQRIEILLKLFKETNCDIILHNFIVKDQQPNFNIQTDFNYISTVNIRINELIQCNSGCIRHLDYNNKDESIHHSQNSIRRSLFDKIQYPEDSSYIKKEDCAFCYRIFELPNIKNVYVSNKLSYYEASQTGGYIN